jgi:hypothetical protein
MSLIQAQKIRILNNWVKAFFTNTIDDYEINGTESVEEFLKSLDCDYENLHEFIYDKYLNDMTNSECSGEAGDIDIMNFMDLDFIDLKLMSYMIEYIHKRRDEDYGMTEVLVDYSVVNIIRNYTYWYSREIDFEFYEELFEGLFTRNNILLK